MNKLYLSNQVGTLATLLVTEPAFLVRIKQSIAEGLVVATEKIPEKFSDGGSILTQYDYDETVTYPVIDIDHDDDGAFVLVDTPRTNYARIGVVSNVMHGREHRIMTPDEIKEKGYLDKIYIKFISLEG